MSEEVRTFDLQVVSVNGIFYNDKAREIIIPCDDGELAILAGHEEMILAIYDGVIKIKKPDGEWIYGVVSLGSVQFTVDNKCLVIVNAVERPEDIDIEGAKEAYQFAMDHLREKQTPKELKKSQDGLARAKARLFAASKYGEKK